MTTMNLLWERAPQSRHTWVADVHGVGRYLIRRSAKGSRVFVLLLKGRPTAYTGTVEELKAIVARIVRAQIAAELQGRHYSIEEDET